MQDTLSMNAAASVTDERPLAFPVVRAQYRHELVARDGTLCLVRRTSTHRDSAGSTHYEVVRLAVVPEAERSESGWIPTGRMVERYPSSESWGTAGFTYTALEPAMARYRALIVAAACESDRGGSVPRSGVSASN